MGKPAQRCAVHGRRMAAALVLGLAGALGSLTGVHPSQGPPILTCVVAQGDTCAAGPAQIVALVGSPLVLDVRVEGFVDADDDGDTLPEGLGAFQFRLDYDPSVVSVSSTSGATEVQLLSLGSTGRSVMCAEPVLGAGSAYLGCGTLGSSPAGPAGSGILARITFDASPQPNAHTELTLTTTLTDPPGNPEPHISRGAAVTVQASLGGVAGLPSGAGSSGHATGGSADRSGWPNRGYAALAGGLATAVLLTGAVAWYARRRRLGQR